jgi:hypothetical protein
VYEPVGQLIAAQLHTLLVDPVLFKRTTGALGAVIGRTTTAVADVAGCEIAWDPLHRTCVPNEYW